jgi:hypothetical protein
MRAILIGIERQNPLGDSDLKILFNALLNMAPSGIFRVHPVSSGYCNIKCLLTLPKQFKRIALDLVFEITAVAFAQ